MLRGEVSTTTWRIWASNEVEKVKDEKDFQRIRLCPFTGDYCISKCMFFHHYKSKGKELYDCYLITLAKALNDIRFRLGKKWSQKT